MAKSKKTAKISQNNDITTIHSDNLGTIEIEGNPTVNDTTANITFDKTPRQLMLAASEGWVFVGHCIFEEDGGILIKEACNIRRWGTEHGLGQLRNGPLSDTEVDYYGLVKIFHPILVMEIDQSVDWKAKCNNDES